jgi:p38 MAP kinase
MLEGQQKPIFHGTSHVEQFSRMSQLLGSPPAEVIESISSVSTLRFVQSLEHFESATFEKRFKDRDQVPVDLLSKILVWDPKKRLTAREALYHPYFQEYAEAIEEDLEEYVEPFDWSFTEEEISCPEWQYRVLQVIDRLKNN